MAGLPLSVQLSGFLASAGTKCYMRSEGLTEMNINIMLFFYNEDGDTKFLRNIGTKLHNVTSQNTVILKHDNFFQNVHHLNLQLRKCQVCDLT
jgi:hypothetical protein